MEMMMVLDVHTGEVLFDGEWPDVQVWLDMHNAQIVPHKRLWENYGFTDDDNSNNVWVAKYARRD